jgi:hypothetical protein
MAACVRVRIQVGNQDIDINLDDPTTAADAVALVDQAVAKAKAALA